MYAGIAELLAAVDELLEPVRAVLAEDSGLRRRESAHEYLKALRR